MQRNGSVYERVVNARQFLAVVSPMFDVERGRSVSKMIHAINVEEPLQHDLLVRCAAELALMDRLQRAAERTLQLEGDLDE